MRKLSNLFRISTFAFVLALMASCTEDAIMNELIQDIEKYDTKADEGTSKDTPPPPPPPPSTIG